MPDIIPASCQAQVVTADGKPVSVAEFFSEGVGPSEGVLLLYEDKAYYLTSNASDLKIAIDTLNQMVTKISTVLSALDGALGGSQAANIALLVAQNVQFALTKETLK